MTWREGGQILKSDPKGDRPCGPPCPNLFEPVADLRGMPAVVAGRPGPPAASRGVRIAFDRAGDSKGSRHEQARE
jgi:hypothetical protein